MNSASMMARRGARGTALLTGGLTAVALAVAATLIVRRVWPAYAAAEPAKAYSTAMLLARLTAGALCTAGAAVVTTRVGRDNGTHAWWLGGIFLGVSLPNHVFRVWADYPTWYHLLYLSYLVPIAGFTGTLSARWSAWRRR